MAQVGLSDEIASLLLMASLGTLRNSGLTHSYTKRAISGIMVLGVYDDRDNRQTVKGVIYSIKASGKIVKVLSLFHAIERIKKWGITGAVTAVSSPLSIHQGEQRVYRCPV